MSLTVDGTAVPVIWRPADLKGPDSDGHAGRLRHPIRAIVHHRVVGSLESMVNATFRPTTDDVLTPGERRVSTHFGIGFWGTELRIVQFVALQDTAFANGQSAADRAACAWRLWIAAGKPPTNEITVSIEHEDNGAAGRYLVREEIIRASIELDRLLLTGDGPRIRAAGIRCTDAAAAQLRRIVPSSQTIIDHHVVAPVSKPYCWRPIGADKGFPQARYVRALTAATPQPPAVQPIPTTPERIVAAQPAPWGYAAYGSAAEWVSPWNGRPAWVSRSRTMAGYAPVTGALPVFVLVHGGPQPLGQLGGMDRLAGWLATRGAVAIAIDYPTLPAEGDWRSATAAITSAVTQARAIAGQWQGDTSRVTLVAHSLGGYFAAIAALDAGAGPDRLVMVAAVNAAEFVGAAYRAEMGNPPDPRALIGRRPSLPVTVIAGTADPVCPPERGQSFVDALNAAGHPGRWIVIDGATHDSILSDTGAIAAILS